MLIAIVIIFILIFIIGFVLYNLREDVTDIENSMITTEALQSFMSDK